MSAVVPTWESLETPGPGGTPSFIETSMSGLFHPQGFSSEDDIQNERDAGFPLYPNISDQ